MPRKKIVNPDQRRNWLLLVAGCLAVTGIALWQYSVAPAPSSRAPRQLTIAAPPAASAVDAQALPSKSVAVVVPAKEAVPASTAKAPAVNAPAAKPPVTKATVTKATVTKAPAVTAPTAAAAAPVARKDLPAPKPVERRPSAAPASVPVATFAIIHDHSRGNFETDDPKATCVGELSIFENELRFEPRDGGDRFAASWADVKDVGGNRFFGSGKGGFHVAVNVGGKYKNFNLAPESKEKAEAKQILDLLNSYTRKTDRTK